MGLKEGYSLHIQDQHDDWLAQEVVETKDSATIRTAYDCWSRSLEGDLTSEVMTDQGDWCEWLAEQEATNPLTPVGSHHSLGKIECFHREWLTILWGILRGRGLDDSHWKEFASLATAKYNQVDAVHRCSGVPTHFVDTEKRVEEGSWMYKSRVVADGTPFFDRCEGVTTSCATASQSTIRIALAMAFAHSDFDPREIVVADVKTAYLTALRSDSLYVHPPKDYPDHGKFLWLLNRTLYGLRDSGNLWDRSRNKTLAAAGWVPSSVRRMW
uniref:Reverse transcriptase Ty1/copia-type domain-containing protein n=1 Tax=Chromera velia CCMP2878 TaxID=1169474 RepID=A0A0G4F915_9ALVE|eukprot:Cvel_2988.t1-p1 / transcript=Cvel_2988.t1 / gene=Cvel_2988 / organism=Chromera_velia_CCMP2878 / gene_product=hypothetical protein / transcript_product=hypothetical protein / location=Cvel_scaffold118:128536-130468(+) / protein_length=269 / sequence_SO=supercontig / SO=protein_coding / is_pseudo=false